MNFTPADPVSLIAFISILVAIGAALIGGIYYSHLKTEEWTQVSPIEPTLKWMLILAIWLLLLAIPVKAGVIEREPMPMLIFFFLAANLGAVLFAFGKQGALLAQTLSLTALVTFQAFRLPLELVLHAWSQSRTVPETMTWTGQNFDIVTGIFALFVPLFAEKQRMRAAWIFNVTGFLLLMNVMRVAVFSSPLPFSWNTSPPLLLAFHLPYAFIIPVCVAGALAGHLILTRKLLASA